MALLRSLSTIFALTAAHPPTGRSDPLPSAACETGNVTFFSYHAHVIFEDGDGSPNRAAALQLQRDFAKAFAIDVEVDPVSCDDSNTTHDLNPPLCMIDADYGPSDFDHGHYGSPACPFLDAEWAVFVPVSRYLAVSQWLVQHRGSLAVMLHPNSGCEVYDHREWPMWAGKKHDLDLTCLHEDCPGCTGDDCRARGVQVVLNGTARACGLEVDTVGPALRLADESLFCQPSCRQWTMKHLPTWASECPYNCDMFSQNVSEATMCAAHMASLEELRSWSQQLCVTLLL